MDGGIVLALPFEGRWVTENSPGRRVPSHGTDLLGGRYAIDFVGVDARHRTSGRRDWRSALSTEPVERFVSYGRPVLAPADGVVVQVHDGETDHVARRSPLTLLSYAWGQPDRLRRGAPAVAGNHVIIALEHSGVFLALAHLRRGSIGVVPGQPVSAGRRVGACGNSGNSTQPHVHVQAMDDPDPTTARGVPIAFRRFREWPRGGRRSRVREHGIPAEGAVVEPL